MSQTEYWLQKLITAYYRKSIGRPFDANDIQYIDHLDAHPDVVAAARKELKRLEDMDRALAGKLDRRDHDMGTRMKALRDMLKQFDEVKNAR